MREDEGKERMMCLVFPERFARGLLKKFSVSGEKILENETRHIHVLCEEKRPMMDYTHRIISDPQVMLGKPVIKGTRITVELLLRKIAEGMAIQDLLEAYPHITEADVLAAIAYSADVIEREELLVP